MLGIAGVVLVVVAIVVLAPHRQRARAGSLATAASLPSGHPQIAGTSQTEATRAVQVAATVKRLAAKYAADPSDTRNLLALAYAYFLDQEFDKAAAAYDIVPERQPGNVTAQVQRAIIWHAQGDDTRARAALYAVIKADAGDQEAHYNLGIVYFAEGKRQPAKAEWEAAARIDPASALGAAAQNFVDLLNGNGATPAAGQYERRLWAASRPG